MEILAYTYLIGWTNLNKWYYGLRWGNVKLDIKPEDDLWVKYFTSSNHVKQFILENGQPDIIQIRKKFKCIEKAKIWENKVLKKLNVSKSEKFLNKTDNFTIENTDKHYEKLANKLRGNPKTLEVRKKMSLAKLKLSEQGISIGYRFYNPAKDPEVRKKMSLAKQGVYNGGKNPNAKKIKFGEVIYSTVKECSDELNISHYLIKKYCKQGIMEIIS